MEFFFVISFQSLFILNKYEKNVYNINVVNIFFKKYDRFDFSLIKSLENFKIFIKEQHKLKTDLRFDS